LHAGLIESVDQYKKSGVRLAIRQNSQFELSGFRTEAGKFSVFNTYGNVSIEPPKNPQLLYFTEQAK
jgi:hypothetical protein